MCISNFLAYEAIHCCNKVILNSYGPAGQGDQLIRKMFASYDKAMEKYEDHFVYKHAQGYLFFEKEYGWRVSSRCMFRVSIFLF